MHSIKKHSSSHFKVGAVIALVACSVLGLVILAASSFSVFGLVAWSIFTAICMLILGASFALFHLAKDYFYGTSTSKEKKGRGEDTELQESTSDRESGVVALEDGEQSIVSVPNERNRRSSGTSSDSGVSEISSPVDVVAYEANYGSQNLINQTQAGNYNYLLQQADVACLARIVQGLDPQGHEIIGSNDQLKKQLNRLKSEIEKNEGNKRLIFIVNLHNGHWVTLCVNYCNKQLSAYYYDSLNGEGNRSACTEILKKELNIGEDNIRFFNEKTQDDGSNCGIFALEAAGRVNQILNKGKSLDDVDEVLLEYKPTGDELETLRTQLAEILSNDEERSGFVVTDLTPININGVKNANSCSIL
jgi:hypothetical protein